MQYKPILGWIKGNIFNIAQTLALIIGFYFAVTNIHLASQALSDNNRIASANFVLDVTKELDRPCYDRITKAMDNPSDYPIIRRSRRNKKAFTVDDVENYIGNFDTLGSLIRDKLINKNMAYDELSYDAEKSD